MREAPRDRLFGRGDFKYVMLDLLQDHPRHGYDIIRSFEERFGGMYAPSPGVVYPTLQMLEDLGMVSASRQEGRKVYALTEEGLAFLLENHQLVEDIKTRMLEWWDVQGGEELNATMAQVHELRVLISRGGRGLTTESLRAIGAALRRAQSEIRTIVGE